jgi:RloB-like protein
LGNNDQLFKRRKAATQESLQRRDAHRKSTKRILIVGEGKTEELYFRAFVKALKLDGVDVDVTSEGGSAPKSVVKFAQKKVKEAGRPDSGGYSHVFCVFDRDDHESYEAAISKTFELNKNLNFPSKIEAITSIPCIEFWFILHHKYCRIPFSAKGNKSVADTVVDHLCEIEDFEDYKKSISKKHLDTLIFLTETAIVNAKCALSEAKVTNQVNPTTNVFKIIEYLREAKEEAKKEAQKSR